MPADNFDKGLLQTAARALDAAVSEGTGYDNLINVLSLMCLLSILNRNQPVPQQTSVSAAPGNPLQKLLGDLSKGDAGGPSPDALMSLLPLLNNPQLKSKMNPGTIAAVMGLLNNMGSSGSDKHEAKSEKVEKPEKTEKVDKTEAADRSTPKQDPSENKNDLPAAAIITPEMVNENKDDTYTESEKRHPGRYLNWKSSF